MWKRRVKKLAARGVRKLSSIVGETAPVVAGPSTRVRDEPATLLDRAYIANRGNRWERKAYHQLAARIKQGAIAERERLGAEYLKAHPADETTRVTVDKVTGLGAADLSKNPLVQAAVEEAQRIAATRDPATSPSKGSLIYLASSQEDFDDNSALSKLALSPVLLRPITEYFGMLPILWGFDINRASSDDLIDTSSHMYHFDPEDTTQLKVFIHLQDIDPQTRPFTALRADLSTRVAESLKYAIGRLTDEQVHGVIGAGHETSFVGPTGSAAFCDTTRCLHFGGRPGRNVRDLIVFYYSIPTTTWLPLHPGDGEPRILIPHLTPKADDPYSAPLLGQALV
jgi:hypothetical protein